MIGGGGGGGGSRDSYYANLVSTEVLQILQNDDRTRHLHLSSAFFRVSLAPSGKITGIKWLRSSGNPTTDDLITRVLTSASLREPWPPDEPLPVDVDLRS
jgi:hypothetical protein